MKQILIGYACCFTDKPLFPLRSPQHGIGRLPLCKANKYAVMADSILIELPVLDAVVDDLGVNAAAA